MLRKGRHRFRPHNRDAASRTIAFDEEYQPSSQSSACPLSARNDSRLDDVAAGYGDQVDKVNQENVRCFLEKTRKITEKLEENCPDEKKQNPDDMCDLDGIFSSPVPTLPTRRGGRGRGRGRKNQAHPDDVSSATARRRPTRQSQPLRNVQISGRCEGKRETIAPCGFSTISELTELGLPTTAAGSHGSESSTFAHCTSQEKARMKELSMIRDHYELHLSGQNPSSTREELTQETQKSSQHCKNSVGPVYDSEAPTSTPQGASKCPLLPPKVMQDLETENLARETSISPIPLCSPEFSGGTSENAPAAVLFGNNSCDLLSPKVEIAAHAIVLPEVGKSVVRIGRSNSENNELARKALRRVSLQWTSSLMDKSKMSVTSRQQASNFLPVLQSLKSVQEEDENLKEILNSIDGSYRQETSGEQRSGQRRKADLSTQDIFELSRSSSSETTDKQEGNNSEVFVQDIRSAESPYAVSPTRRKKKSNPKSKDASFRFFSDEEPKVMETGENGFAECVRHLSLENGKDTHNVSTDSKDDDEIEGSGSECSSSFGSDISQTSSREETGNSFMVDSKSVDLSVASLMTNASESVDFDRELQQKFKTPGTEQKRTFSRLSVGGTSVSPYYLRGMVGERSPMEDCLFVCQQEVLLRWDEAFPKSMISKCRKIGEGVYGEVFRTTNPKHGEHVAIKVIPVEGNDLVNDERQKSFEEILPEILIAKEMSELRRRDDYNMTPNFVEVKSVALVQGRYPKKLLEAWDFFDREKHSQNDKPDGFPVDQLFVVFEFGDGGSDLESFTLKTVEQAYSIIGQVCMALAVAEEALEFEHRDLHIGNILIKETHTPTIAYKYRGAEVLLRSCGVMVFIIDFTNSRLKKDGCTIFTDLSMDEGLFEGPKNEYQFEIYRMMRNRNSNEWKSFVPQTNIYWMHYLVDKMRRREQYGGKCLEESNGAETQKARKIFDRLVEDEGELLACTNCIQLFFGKEFGAFEELVDELKV